MKYTSGTVGRIFTVRFEDSDPIYKNIEEIALQENIPSAAVWIVGGVKNGGVVVGPEDTITMPPLPMTEYFTDAREILGFGTLFRNEQNKPSLHMHASIGKGTKPLTGCPRKGLDCWLVTEAVILEMTGMNARRIADPRSGFSLLEIVQEI